MTLSLTPKQIKQLNRQSTKSNKAKLRDVAKKAKAK